MSGGMDRDPGTCIPHGRRKCAPCADPTDKGDAWGELRAHWHRSHQDERAEREAWTTDAMRLVRDQVDAMVRTAGWFYLGRYPKPGEIVLAWEPTQPPFRASMDRGHWWAHVDGDTWPAHPVLWKPLIETKPKKGTKHVRR